MAALTSAARKALPKSDFAVPSAAPKAGSYPLPNASHARAALSMVSRFGSPATKVKVRAAVARKFPEIGKHAAGGANKLHSMASLAG